MGRIIHCIIHENAELIMTLHTSYTITKYYMKMLL